MLGFLHKIVLKECHSLLCQAFPFAEGLMTNYHSKSLHLFSEEVPFLDYNFAPPCLRRDIGILDFLHKRVLGKCHPSVQEFFPPAAPSPYWHDKQLMVHLTDHIVRPQLYNRSIFGMVHVYNRLPQEVVDQDSVSKFQACLTDMAKRRCHQGLSQGLFSWKQMFRTPCAWH